MIDEWKKGAKYWDHAWNPVIGCRKVSEGCANCYAASMAERFPELQDSDGGFNPHAPKMQKSPPKSGVVFVGNMTDLFGEWNTDEQLRNWLYDLSMDDDAVNLILTKRTERMAQICWNNKDLNLSHWFGITAENQARLEERAPHLMRTIATHKWASLEPLLGEIDIRKYLLTEHDKRGFDQQYIPPPFWTQYHDKFDWVVVGAESGANRRPCKLEWVAQIVEDCWEYNVPVFVKQLDLNGKLEKDINKFPPELQIRQIPWKERI